MKKIISILIDVFLLIQFALLLAWIYLFKIRHIPYAAVIAIPFAIVTVINLDLKIYEEEKKNPKKFKIIIFLALKLLAVWMIVDSFLSLL